MVAVCWRRRRYEMQRAWFNRTFPLTRIPIDERSGQTQFLSTLMGYTYSDVYRSSSKHNGLARYFFQRSGQFGLEYKYIMTGIEVCKRYPATHLLRSTATELAREFRRHWQTVSKEFHQQVNALTPTAVTMPMLDQYRKNATLTVPTSSNKRLRHEWIKVCYLPILTLGFESICLRQKTSCV
jgi:hypothetical protein